MRRKRNTQNEFDFQPSNLAVTQVYFARYEKISRILDDHPRLLDLVHKDLEEILRRQEASRDRECRFTTENVVRIILCQIIEGESLRRIVVRIDDSNYLRRFVRIYNGRMMDYTTLCMFKNAIKSETWKRINELLTRVAVERELINGERLRIDTTAYETNIRWPTDSGLLWDTYRVLARLIDSARGIDPRVGIGRRLHRKKAKRLYTKIARLSGKKGRVSKDAKVRYECLIGLVEGILEWTRSASEELGALLKEDEYGEFLAGAVENLIARIGHFRALGLKVVDQARRRVLGGEKVPNDEKIFSIFEPHTELLKRGKAGKSIEFGHMIALQQVEGGFITDYDVFEKKPVDYKLVGPALKSHRKVFGESPREFCADKGFYESMERLEELEEEIEVVSICKKGARTEEQAARESSRSFRLAQKFRAGIEGSISVLKRALRMWRCMNKGLVHYSATVGATILAHNFLILARGYG